MSHGGQHTLTKEARVKDLHADDIDRAPKVGLAKPCTECPVVELHQHCGWVLEAYHCMLMEMRQELVPMGDKPAACCISETAGLGHIHPDPSVRRTEHSSRTRLPPLPRMSSSDLLQTTLMVSHWLAATTLLASFTIGKNESHAMTFPPAEDQSHHAWLAEPIAACVAARTWPTLLGSHQCQQACSCSDVQDSVSCVTGPLQRAAVHCQHPQSCFGVHTCLDCRHKGLVVCIVAGLIVEHIKVLGVAEIELAVVCSV